MNFSNASVIRWLGPNLEKGKKNYQDEEKRAKKAFVKKYPYARKQEFEFWPTIDSNGDLIQPAEVRYVADGNMLLPNLTGTMSSYSWPITSNTFKYRYSFALYFGPTAFWNPGGKQQSFERSEATLSFNPFKFKAFVSEDKSFTSSFPNIAINWVNSQENKNILKAKFDTSDPYFNSLASAMFFVPFLEFAKIILKTKKVCHQLLPLFFVIFSITQSKVLTRSNKIADVVGK